MTKPLKKAHSNNEAQLKDFSSSGASSYMDADIALQDVISVPSTQKAIL